MIDKERNLVLVFFYFLFFIYLKIQKEEEEEEHEEFTYVVQVRNPLRNLLHELAPGFWGVRAGVQLGTEGLTKLPDLAPQLLTLTKDDEHVLHHSFALDSGETRTR